MCGIVGFCSTEPFDKEKLKVLMLYNSIERGRNASGFFTPKTGVCKSNKNATDFLTDEKVNILEDTLFIGHVRQATVGQNTEDNAHPFKYGRIVGVHNGTLTNHQQLLAKNNLSWADYNVDSQVIMKLLDLNRKPNVLAELEGSAAVLFNFDKHENTLYVYRTYDKELFRGKIGNSMYISSIKDSLKFIGCEDIKEFKERVLYTIKDGVIASFTKLPKVYTATGSTTGTTDYYIPPAKDYVGRMISCDSYHVTDCEKYGLTRDKFYKVIGYGKNKDYGTVTDTFIVNNDQGIRTEAPKGMFAAYASIPKEGNYASAANNLNLNGELLCKEGTAIRIVKVDLKAKKAIGLVTTNFKAGEITFKLKQLRACTTAEEKEGCAKYLEYLKHKRTQAGEEPEEDDVDMVDLEELGDCFSEATVLLDKIRLELKNIQGTDGALELIKELDEHLVAGFLQFTGEEVPI